MVSSIFKMEKPDRTLPPKPFCWPTKNHHQTPPNLTLSAQVVVVFYCAIMLIIIGSNVHRCKSTKQQSEDKKGNQSAESIIDLSKKSNILIELEKQKSASLKRETFCLLEDDLEDGEDRMRNELGEIV